MSQKSWERGKKTVKRSLVLKRKLIKDSKNLEKSLYVRDKAGPSGGTALKQVMEIPAWVQESVSVTMAHRAIHTSRLKLCRDEAACENDADIQLSPLGQSALQMN